MSQDSFSVQRRLRTTLTLAPENSNGVFPGTKSNTLVLDGLRTAANVQTVPGAVATHADIRIFGMRQQDMNALTTIFFNAANGRDIKFNNVLVEASNDAGKSWSQVFSGMITEAYPNYSSAPVVFFGIQAVTGYQFQITPVPPTSYQGTISVADIVGELAGVMGYAFENDGVTAQLSNPYFSGTYWDQLNQACQAAGAIFTIAGNTLALYPANSPRGNPPLLTLTPDSGLIGYPQLEKFGVVLESLYNPGLQPGGRVKVDKSDVPAANGIWYPFMIDHQLEAYSQTPQWKSVSQCKPVAS